MNRIVALVAVACCVSAATARAEDDPARDGPHPVRAVKLDVIAGGKKTFVDVRLPARPAGDAKTPRPVVLICHGWAASIYNYERIADHLATRGFAAVLFQQPNRWSNDTEGWAKQIGEALTALEFFGADPRGPLSGELDGARVGLVGHSYGGAAVVWRAASDPRVKCVVGLAPVNQPNRKKLLEKAGEVTAPLLVVAGDSDWLATNKTYTRPIHDRAVRAAFRDYLEVKGGDHNFYTGTGERSKLASRRYTAWLERFLLPATAASGETTGLVGAIGR